MSLRTGAILLISFSFLMCSRVQRTAIDTIPVTVMQHELKQHLLTLSHDSMEGRNTATDGQRKAAAYIVAHLQSVGVKPVHRDSLGKLTYLQDYPFVRRFGSLTKYSPYAQNIVGLIEGSGTLKEEYIVISAHYDHLGVKDSVVYNGADDNGSGSSSVLEIARALTAATSAQENRRSVLIIFFSGEEKGLMGSEYYSEHPVIPLEKCVANLNVDMIGRADSQHMKDSNYIYLIGSDRLSKILHILSEETNRNCCRLKLDYKYNSKNDPLNLYYRSDHYNFAKNNVPVIFYFSGLHPDYHQPQDDAEKINIGILQKRANLILNTAWTLMLHQGKIRE